MEVRDPDDEQACLTLYQKGPREVVRRLAAYDVKNETPGSRGTGSPAAAAMLVQRPNYTGVRVPGRRARLSSREIMDGPASRAACDRSREGGSRRLAKRRCFDLSQHRIRLP